MVADRRLDNILRILLQPGAADPNRPEGSRVYASAATVLATLTNPLNVSLLSTQILVSPAIWQTPDGLRAALRTFGVFQSAVLGKIESPGVILGVEDWLNALVRGANQNVPRWKHLLLLGAVLSADQERSHLPRLTRKSVEEAYVRAVNLSLVQASGDGYEDLEADVLSLVLSHAIGCLSRKAKAQINYDALLPAVVKSIYFSKEGFQSGYFLPTIDHDIVVTDGKLAWPSKSNSFLELQERSARPLFVSMSGLAKLAGCAIQEAHDVRAVHALLDSIQKVSNTMAAQWKTNRLSEIPMSKEEEMVEAESLKATVPVVWQILKTVLFTTTIILQALTARVIQNPVFCNKENGPIIASRILHTLHGFYFITSRMGPGGFSSYNFVYYAAIDVLSSYPKQAEKFLSDVAPKQVGRIPPSLADRLRDLYFLNVCEQIVPVVSPKVNEEIVIPALSAYLVPGLEQTLQPHFEAAHSVMLAILASPTSAEIGATIMPFYVDAVFKAFPTSLSARQFRLAFCTLVGEASPPQPISSLHPHMVDVLLEILCEKISTATTTSLAAGVDEEAVGLSEKDVCILALINSLPLMEVKVMLRWLDPAARLLNSVDDVNSRQRIKERFWDVLSGELDVSRAEVAVRWWGNGGRDKVVLGKVDDLEGIRPRL
ncbi:hypothetical protein FN846DRAFT_945599 [Sphaerosporella brunnea]|uniref:Peroxin 8 n=1 Tax=Sphaerosporella brunnea TaxID=1250544 RepID=A0A5J5EYX2_9PEZI|nr:hypothetical protein FN846DRAFT_945599 [Sphaerosporella brunnea]